jgi:hypothetical protein
MYNEASNSYRKSDPNEALNCLLKTVDIYIDMVFFYCHLYSYVQSFNHLKGTTYNGSKTISSDS